MCLPALAFIGAALGASAATAATVGTLATVGTIGAGLSAYGSYKGAQAQKAQANLAANNAAEQAALANENAGKIEAYAKDNVSLVLGTTSLNNQIAQAVSDANIGLINTTTDFNVGIIKSTTDFNVSSAEGAARLLEAQGQNQETVHNQNAQLLEVQAQDSLDRGAQAERQSRQAYAQIKGTQRASLAANGVTLDEGSALRIQADTDFASDQDADTIKTNALKAAFGYRVQGVNEVTAGKFASLDAQSQAMGKRTEAAAARINASVGIAQAELDRSVKTLDNKMTTSVKILSANMDAKVEALNIQHQAESDAWASRASAKGYLGAAAQARLTAKTTSPFLAGATSLLNGASQVAATWYRPGG